VLSLAELTNSVRSVGASPYDRKTMSARYFADYVKEFKRAGALSLESPALVCHDDGHDAAPPSSVGDTAMGVEPGGFSFAGEGAATELPPTQARPAVAPMRPSLVDPRFGPRVTRSSAQGGSVPLEQDPLRLVFPIIKRVGTAFDHISIGRTASMDVVLPLLQVSKFHAYFTRDTAGAYTLADAGSKNGTWIGTRRLPVRTPEPVRDGDRIRLGMYMFTFLTQAGFLELVKTRAVHWVETPTRPSETGVRRSPG
jgi:hypothetical protein